MPETDKEDTRRGDQEARERINHTIAGKVAGKVLEVSGIWDDKKDDTKRERG